jgi:AraC-like DNA-binding protein
LIQDYAGIFFEVDKQLLREPLISLGKLTTSLNCSHPTIQKAVLKNVSLIFREYRKTKLLNAILFLHKKGYSAKQIAFEIGYKWPEHFRRFVKSYTGHNLAEVTLADRQAKAP